MMPPPSEMHISQSENRRIAVVEFRPNFDAALARVMRPESNDSSLLAKEQASSGDSFGAWFEWD